jgi:hypothetical protein
MSSISILFAIIAAVIEPGDAHIASKDLSHYLPAPESLRGWNPAYPPQTFVGDNLYDLINGGASIYHEYGFIQVITQQYMNADSQYMILELYEMKNSTAAFGMYTYKTGRSGKTIDIGAEASLEDHYLNFWKARFVCTVTGSSSDEDITEALLMIARAVAERITNASRRPQLVNFLPADSLHRSHIAYVKGTLGLSQYLMFDDADMFDIKEAVIGDYEDYRIFVFKYDNVKQCAAVFQTMQDDVRNHPEYTNFAAFEGAFSVRDGEQSSTTHNAAPSCLRFDG